jgi:hypothetical protein
MPQTGKTGKKPLQAYIMNLVTTKCEQNLRRFAYPASALCACWRICQLIQITIELKGIKMLEEIDDLALGCASVALGNKWFNLKGNALKYVLY